MADCTGGTIPSLQVQNTDCNCVSIQSITWNAAGNQFTITLTNGQSITSPVLEGSEGASPVVLFRVSGTILQYNIDGGVWVSIYDFAALTGSKILANQFPALSTLGTAYESLLVGRTPYILPAATLAANDAQIEIHAIFTTSSWTSSAQRVRITFNAGALNTPLNIAFFASNVSQIEINARLVRVNNTSIKYEMEATYSTIGIGGVTFVQKYSQTITDIAGLDLAANPYNIDAQGDSVVIGDVTCTAFSVKYTPKI